MNEKNGVNQQATKAGNGLQQQILDFCKHIAGPSKIVAVCQSDDYTLEAPSAKATIEVIVVLQNFPTRLMSYGRFIEGRNVIFFAVDQWVFERDVERGTLGEALASLLIFPYTELTNGAYLHEQEIALKKRLILELLENMVLSYPELSYTIRFQPEYFMYEVMLNRVRVFPPLANGAAYFLCGEANQDKVKMVLDGYKEALNQLEKQGIIYCKDNFIMLSEQFIAASNNPKTRVTNTIKNAPRAVFSSLFNIFPQLLNFFSQNSESLLQFQTPIWKKEFEFARNFVDPQKYVFVPMSQGFVSLADKVDIRGFVQNILKISDLNKLSVEEFGGVLNDVYLIRINMGNSENKILVKRFKDLSSLKWFPLSMWSIGARSFSMRGRSRLERECAINELLNDAGFHVPKILHVSANERLVFMEFLEAENLGSGIKQMGLTHDESSIERELALISQVGKTYAQVHSLNVVLGDTKPENVMVGKQGELYLIDFEQASRNGDKSWDIACFLYYCGHYLPLNSEHKAEALTKAFIAGYLEGGGDLNAIKHVAKSKYTRVFSIFTLPSLLLVIANTCKKAECKK
jgi:tRNA A-37 threonylcarbamoyl transferase component Bud32